MSKSEIPVMRYWQIWNETAGKNDWLYLSKEPWYDNKSGLTEKYVTEKET